MPAALLALVLSGCQGLPGGSRLADGSSGSGNGSGDGAAASSAVDGSEGGADGGSGDQAAAAELPRGGTELFPRYRLVGYVGYPGSPGMGRLGIGDLDERVSEIEPELGEYAGDRELMPVLELVVSIAHPQAGADGSYRTQAPPEMIDEHLEAARRHDAMLLLNIQTGAVDFPEEVKAFEKWLAEPDVGVALDPEWAVEPGQVPGEVYGRTTGEELDEVSAYLSDLVAQNGLPEKAMVFHQVHKDVVQDEEDLTEHEGVQVIRSVDGIGHREDKTLTYDLVTRDTSDLVRGGFKLFLEEDVAQGPLMTPEEVLGLEPEVEYVMVE